VSANRNGLKVHTATNSHRASSSPAVPSQPPRDHRAPPPNKHLCTCAVGLRSVNPSRHRRADFSDLQSIRERVFAPGRHGRRDRMQPCSMETTRRRTQEPNRHPLWLPALPIMDPVFVAGINLLGARRRSTPVFTPGCSSSSDAPPRAAQSASRSHSGGGSPSSRGSWGRGQGSWAPPPPAPQPRVLITRFARSWADSEIPPCPRGHGRCDRASRPHDIGRTERAPPGENAVPPGLYKALLASPAEYSCASGTVHGVHVLPEKQSSSWQGCATRNNRSIPSRMKPTRSRKDRRSQA
jgi:hypothetical protein